MKDLNDIQAFVSVVRAGSFTLAAKNLGLPLSTLSDRVRFLEAELGLALLIRTTRKLQLTEVGQRFFDSSAQAVDALLFAAESAIQCNSEPRGTLRLTAPSDFASEALAAAIAEYRRLHPQVKVEAVITNRVVDIIGENFDIAVRGGALKDSTLLSKRIGLGHMLLAASPNYLANAGQVTGLKDLTKHIGIAYVPGDSGREEMPWELRASSGRSQRLKPDFRVHASSFLSVMELARAGAGIALVPEYMAWRDLKEGRLIRLLPEYATEPAPLSLVYPRLALDLPKVREMIPLLEKHLTPLFDDTPCAKAQRKSP